VESPAATLCVSPDGLVADLIGPADHFTVATRSLPPGTRSVTLSGSMLVAVGTQGIQTAPAK
jgi:hypothetical protein